MQLLLIPSNRSKFTRPLAKALVVVALALSATFAPHSAQAQSRRAKAASNANAKIQVLQSRRRKAVAIYNNALAVVGKHPVFLVQGKIESGDSTRLVVYGQTYEQNEAANHSLGQNNEDSFLTIHNPAPACISAGRYVGYCEALNQTEYIPAPASYYTAVATLDKYREIIASLDGEMEFERQSGARAAQARAKVKLARAKEEKARQEKAQAAGRESFYRARLALSDKETTVKLAQLDTLVTGASDKGGAYGQSSAAATALFNEWGQLGVANRTLLWRAFDDLAQAAAWQVERGDWTGATSTAEKLLTLELFERTPNDAGTGRKRIELGLDERDLRLPSTAVGRAMHREGPEPAAAAHLAQAWLEKLPAYLAGPAPREEKLRVAKLSQLLGAEVFALQPGRIQTIAVAVDALRGTYGPSALAVVPEFASAVEVAKRERVARQVEEFSQPGAPNAPVEPPHVARTFEDVPPETATTNAPQESTANAPQAPPAPKAAEKPAQKLLVPAVDFTMRSFLSTKKVRLSDFRGKTVILYFWDLSWDDHNVSPSPAEQLFALSKRYDFKRTALLLVNKGGLDSYALRDWKNMIEPNPRPDPRRGYAARLYPREIYALESERKPGQASEQEMFDFYGGDKNARSFPDRVTVINPRGEVVGTVDFEQDRTATQLNFRSAASAYNVYDFDEAALEDLLARAMAPQP